VALIGRSVTLGVTFVERANLMAARVTPRARAAVGGRTVLNLPEGTTTRRSRVAVLARHVGIAQRASACRSPVAIRYRDPTPRVRSGDLLPHYQRTAGTGASRSRWCSARRCRARAKRLRSRCACA
jgi:hypothetical protein